MTKVEKVVKKLEEKLENGMADLTMKVDGRTVYVDKWLNGTFEIWFEKCGMVYNAKNIEEVAEVLIEYPKKAIELMDEETRWFNESEPKFLEFCKKYIDGKSYDEIDDDTWGTYSDWHKDLYGFRPR